MDDHSNSDGVPNETRRCSTARGYAKQPGQG